MIRMVCCWCIGSCIVGEVIGVVIGVGFFFIEKGFDFFEVIGMVVDFFIKKCWCVFCGWCWVFFLGMFELVGVDQWMISIGSVLCVSILVVWLFRSIWVMFWWLCEVIMIRLLLCFVVVLMMLLVVQWFSMCIGLVVMFCLVVLVSVGCSIFCVFFLWLVLYFGLFMQFMFQFMVLYMLMVYGLDIVMILILVLRFLVSFRFLVRFLLVSLDLLVVIRMCLYMVGFCGGLLDGNVIIVYWMWRWCFEQD